MELIDKTARFIEDMYDWKLSKVKKYLKENSKNDFFYIEFNHKELGRDDEWFESQCRALNNDWFKIKREILLEWTKSSDLCPFNEAQLDELDKYLKEPTGTLFINDIFPFTCYEDFDFRDSVIISCDPSGGLERDSSAITIASGKNLHVLADFENNKIDVPQLAEIITKLCEYFPNGPIVIERNNYGLTLIQILLKNPEMEKRLYYEYKQTTTEKKVKDVKQKTTTTTRTKVYGITTTKTTRSQMIDLLFDYVNNPYEGLNSKRLSRDISGLERKKNSKIEHSETSHDDNLMSWLFIQWVWNYGTSLNRFFITKRDVRNINGREQLESDETEQQFRLNFHAIAKANNSTFGREGIHSSSLNHINADSVITDFIEEERKQAEFDALMNSGSQKNGSGMLGFLMNINK